MSKSAPKLAASTEGDVPFLAGLAVDSQCQSENQPHTFEGDRQTILAVIDSLLEPVLVIDRAGLIAVANDPAQLRFGIVSGMSVESAGLNWLSDIVAHVAASGEPFRACGYKNALQFTDNGREQFLVPTACPIFLRDRLSSIVVTLLDVTRTRRVDEWYGNHLALFSHELRTPLASIHMAISMLMDGTLGQLSVRQSRSLRVAASDLDRLNRIIDAAIEAASSATATTKLSVCQLETDRSLPRPINNDGCGTEGQ